LVSDRDQVAEHLKFFEELGVDGISRDRLWRTRPGEGDGVETRPEGAVRPAVARGEDAAVPPGEGAAVPPGEDAAVSPGEGAAVAPIPSWTSDSLWDAPAAPATDDVPPAERLRGIREELGDCTRCRLHGGRSHLVFGVGRPDAELMFVGEAPGRDEDLQGEPFVGRAGQLLTKIIEAIDLRRQDVYIANVIKCRPPQNRNPERDEVETCRPFLFAQIDAVRPRVIVALGSFAVRTLLDDDRLPISRARGRVYKCRGASLVPTFHPAFLLRSPDRKRDVWEDMKRVRSILRGD
jgi:DNA polymerase